ncbi:hypothetical protein OOZ51_21555 [Arthrobacter sp. MI7-26]|uniref:hypothetical protein n=1 Tax=Arthrobacter sp. MI7-26 TaxID=2993653 RepID=UPI0022499955|nr:hypothetical protein [Arthrobacter sp. MI7-26]MCX2750371.1 hypothetical protein [Arthrobacter sp. MI7-26]
MSKSRRNSIALSHNADETARLILGAKTESLRHDVVYDNVHMIMYEAKREAWIASIDAVAGHNHDDCAVSD